MSFDVYGHTQKTLDGVITDTKDLTTQQDKSIRADRLGQTGQIIADFSVAMFDEAEAGELAIGTYTMKAVVPKNSIITKVVVNTTVAKAGSGTLTPAIGADTLTAISSAGVNDDTSALASSPLEVTTEQAITVAVASDTVTAGSFVMYIDYVPNGEEVGTPVGV